MRILKENTLGLVIDIQEKLVPVMHKKDTLINNCKILIKGLLELNISLIVSEQYTKGLGKTIPEISSEIQNFSPVEKTDFSCCDEPAISTLFSNPDKKNIVICGIESHVCVLQTAIDLKDSGYNPIVVMDCISSRNLENIELAKERFRFENIMMTSYESILFELAKSSKIPEFKTISKLVK